MGTIATPVSAKLRDQVDEQREAAVDALAVVGGEQVGLEATGLRDDHGRNLWCVLSRALRSGRPPPPGEEARELLRGRVEIGGTGQQVLL